MTTIDTANACCAANAGDTAPVTDAVPRTIAEACDVVTTPHLTLPADGVFGGYGGSVLPAALERPMAEVAQAYDEARNDPEFYAEYLRLLREFVGRPSSLTFADRLSQELGGARIVLKREDLNHTGSHKINHCLGEALLAKRMGKSTVIAETGAGQHGVALATAAALLGLKCEIHMGAIDVAKQHPNVVRMKMLGAKVVAVETGGRSLKEAVDSAFEVYARNCDDYLYAIGSVVGPHPFPSMVRDFQTVIGREARAQLLAARGALPAAVVACVGGGSNAMGAFTAFLDDADVRLIGVEPAGRGQQRGEHAMSIAKGTDAVLHGMRTKVLVNDQGEPDAVHSIASGLDYPGVGPQHAYFDQVGRVEYVGITDDQVLDAFIRLSRTEGIIPALESAHAVAHAMVMAPTMSRDSYLVVNLSGRGDKDLDHVAEQLGMGGEPDTVADAPAASLNV
ncbi:tryptophan synthase subunit beta [Cutibacterium granulosum]|uniref:tryptophan synthase subunit beta n=1 Tax=Cutibacterium granulosum TaxID=33011 RepID=UPI002B22438D|nr:tryptophan synthase subunit beta [Cutibacterium granulosum]MEA5638742.1 tryptophan synthase subunit beta [Cutibacterium granulosum]